MNDQSIQKPILSAIIALAVVGFSPSAEAGIPVPYCGDGEKQGEEECDDGNNEDDDGCSSDCEDEPSSKPACCGDGVKDPGEECDDGNMSNTDHCTNDCEDAECGDGHVQPGEECDGGQSCTSDCQTKNREACCGDGIVQDGEECDDGNMSNTDECTNVCKDAECGDGFEQPGEECDGGSDCTEDCKDKVEDNCTKDDDHDGVLNCDDLCPGTGEPPKIEDVPLSGTLKPNHFALTDEGEPYTFDTMDPKTKETADSSDPKITIEDTGGCSCEQILDKHEGEVKGQYEYGCSPGTIKSWIKEVEEGEAAPVDEEDDLNVPDADGMKWSCNMSQNDHAPAWAFLGLVLAAVLRRRRS